jgi:hypothetical protein
VADGTFFHDSTAWMKDNGIADGYNDGSFRTGGNITRGQASFWFANYNNALELVKNSANLSNPIIGGGEFRRTAVCPAGKRAVAGGGETGNARMAMHASVPNGLSWSVDWASDDGTDQVPGVTEVWALCVPRTIP